MVDTKCLENNGTDPLTCSCRWKHEGADLWWYVWGFVRSGTTHQKHNATWLVRAFSVDDTNEIWCPPTIDTRRHRQHHCFWFLTLSCQCILTHSVTQDGLTRTRNTNLAVLTSENMWYQHILIELLTVLLLLQPHIHISSCSSLHSSKCKKDS